MTMPEKLECSLVRDLLIPYAANEVQPQTLAFINLHLSGCEACRGALAEVTSGLSQPVAPPPPADAGRKVVNRVRRNVLVLIAVVVLALSAAGGSIYFAVQTVVNLAGMNVPHLIPPAGYNVAQLGDHIDLTHIGLKSVRHGTSQLGNEYVYQQADGQQITVTYEYYTSPGVAAQDFKHWVQNGSKTMSVESASSTHQIAKFRRAGYYYYGWQVDKWTFIIAVPGTVPDPAARRDEVRDAVMEAIANL